MRSRASLLLLVAALAVLSACTSSPPDYPDWTIPVPEGTPIIEYTAAQLEVREFDTIDLVEDLRIGGDEEDPDALFYMLRDLAVDDRGWLYVSEIGNGRVQVFDTTGKLVRSIGRSGEGPGEFTANEAVEIVGEHIVVNDPGVRRLGVWTLKGEHVGDYSVQPQIGSMFAVSEDGLVAQYSNWQEDQPYGETVVSRYDLAGHEIFRYASLAQSPSPSVALRTDNPYHRAVLPIGIPRPSATASPSGRVYLTAGEEYQLLALTELGDPLWALRAEWTRQPVEQSEIELALEEFRPLVIPAEIAKVDWPEIQPALSRSRFPGEPGHPLRVDGHGHLYVFPYIEAPWLKDRRMRPVHVYSENGDLLFAGSMPTCNWTAEWRDFVYAIEDDPRTGNQVVVRYRLVEPF